MRMTTNRSWLLVRQRLQSWVVLLPPSSAFTPRRCLSSTWVRSSRCNAVNRGSSSCNDNVKIAQRRRCLSPSSRLQVQCFQSIFYIQLTCLAQKSVDPNPRGCLGCTKSPLWLRIWYLYHWKWIFSLGWHISTCVWFRLHMSCQVNRFVSIQISLPLNFKGWSKSSS